LNGAIAAYDGRRGSQLLLTGVAVEKLLLAKFAKIKSRWDALQTTFSVFLDIFYPPNLGCFEENGLFQQPQAITLKTPVTGSMSVMAMLRQSSSAQFPIWRPIAHSKNRGPLVLSENSSKHRGSSNLAEG
jgi:hypothetical protein